MGSRTQIIDYDKKILPSCFFCLVGRAESVNDKVEAAHEKRNISFKQIFVTVV
jgi:hypothetical protein